MRRIEWSPPPADTPDIFARSWEVLLAEQDRLELDLSTAVRLQDYDQLDRLMIVTMTEWGCSTADHVGWVVSTLRAGETPA